MQRRTFLKTTGILGAGLVLKPAFYGNARVAPVTTSNNEKLLKKLIDAAMKQGATFADARFTIEASQSIQVRKDLVYSINESENAGFALRVYKGGQWGLAAASETPLPDARSMAKQACDAAEAAGKIQPMPFSAEGRLSSHVKDWKTSHEQDPFAVPLDEKIEFLLSIIRPAIAGSKIAYAVSNIFQVKKHVLYASSIGGLAHQTWLTTWPNYALTAFNQRSGQIDSVTGMTEPLSIGYEITKRIPFHTEIWRSMDYVEELQSAKSVTPGDYDVVMSPSHLWRVLFETLLPHLDSWSVAGIESGQHGASLLADEKAGFRIANSPLLNLDYDSTLPVGLASYAWDDAGRPASSGSLVREGVLERLPGSDELPAGAFPWKDSVTRAASWQAVPRYSMPNIILAPSQGGEGVDQLAAKVEKGLLLEGRGPIERSINRRWFRAGTQLAWLIENGKRTRIVRDAVYETSVSFFWKKLMELGGASSLGIGGELSPKRIYPFWDLPFSVATPPALFGRMLIGADTGGKP